eukprot:403372582
MHQDSNQISTKVATPLGVDSIINQDLNTIPQNKSSEKSAHKNTQNLQSTNINKKEEDFKKVIIQKEPSFKKASIENQSSQITQVSPFHSIQANSKNYHQNNNKIDQSPQPISKNHQTKQMSNESPIKRNDLKQKFDQNRKSIDYQLKNVVINPNPGSLNQSGQLRNSANNGVITITKIQNGIKVGGSQNLDIADSANPSPKQSLNAIEKKQIYSQSDANTSDYGYNSHYQNIDAQKKKRVTRNDHKSQTSHQSQVDLQSLNQLTKVKTAKNQINQSYHNQSVIDQDSNYKNIKVNLKNINRNLSETVQPVVINQSLTIINNNKTVINNHGKGNNSKEFNIKSDLIDNKQSQNVQLNEVSLNQQIEKMKQKKYHSLNASIDMSGYDSNVTKIKDQGKNQQSLFRNMQVRLKSMPREASLVAAIAHSLPSSKLNDQSIQDFNTSSLIQENQSTQDTPLKMYGQGDVFNYNQGRKGNRLKGFNEKQQPIVATLHITKDLNKSEVFSEAQPTSQSYFQRMSLNYDRYSSGAYSPQSDKTFIQCGIKGDSFYQKFQQFKTKFDGQPQVFNSEREPQSNSNSFHQKTANFAQLDQHQMPTRLPDIQKVTNNFKSKQFQAQAKQTFSAPQQLVNPRQDQSSNQVLKHQIHFQNAQKDVINHKHDSKRRNFQSISGVSQTLEKNNSQSLTDGPTKNFQSQQQITPLDEINLNVTFAQKQMTLNPTKAKANNLKLEHKLNNQLNSLEITKLKQQEEQVKQINSNKKKNNYSPHNYSEYQDMLNQYNQQYKKLGGLGPNIGTQEWQDKHLKLEKINQYANQIKKDKVMNTINAIE